jgi:hypothetical protein
MGPEISLPLSRQYINFTNIHVVILKFSFALIRNGTLFWTAWNKLNGWNYRKTIPSLATVLTTPSALLSCSEIRVHWTNTLLQTKLRGLSPRANCTERKTAPLVGEVSANLRIEVCRVVSAADTLRPYSRLSRPKPLLFLSSSASIAFTRLSGPCCRPTASQKIW